MIEPDPEPATAPLDDIEAGPLEVPEAFGEEAVEAVPFPDTTEVMTVPLLLEGRVATEEATGAVVVAGITEVTRPFPPPREGESPPVGIAVESLDAILTAEPDAEPEDETGVEPDPTTEDDCAAALEEAEGLADGAGQLRSYNGVVLKVEPTIPKLGLGVIG